MAFVSVVRLRLRSVRFLPMFFVHANRSWRQAARSTGFLDGTLLPDDRHAYWAMTLWREQGDMMRYMGSGAHAHVMPKLVEWCDEASVVHWRQDGDAVPGWREADRRMRAEGRPSTLRRASPHHQALTFASPRLA